MALSRRLLWVMVVVGWLGVPWGGTAYAGTGVTVSWDETYGTGTLFDTAYDVQPAPDGGFIAVGVQDYRILDGPEDDREALRRELNRILIFTTFRPATSFGKPAPDQYAAADTPPQARPRSPTPPASKKGSPCVG